MADQYPKESQAPSKAEEEAQGCGMFDFLKKKENEKPHHDEQEPHKHTLAEKLHKPHDGNSSSSSSSDEEDGEKKKKGLKGKLKEKISGKKEEGDAYHASVQVEKTHDIKNGAPHGEDKKGFIEKIKDKLPGQHKEAEHGAPAEYHAMDGHAGEGEPKKGILEKIKDKLPGAHKNEEEKPKDKDY